MQHSQSRQLALPGVTTVVAPRGVPASTNEVFPESPTQNSGNKDSARGKFEHRWVKAWASLHIGVTTSEQSFSSSVSVVFSLDTNQYTLVAAPLREGQKTGRLRLNRTATNRPVLLGCLDPPHFDEQDPPVLDSRAGKACTSSLSRTRTSSLSPSIVTDCRGHDLHDLVKTA